MSTKAQQTYERINALVDGGMQKADAMRQLAEEYGQPVDSIRGAYYSAKRQLEGGAGTPAPRSRSRKRETTTDDAVAAAVASMERSINDIEQELEVAANRALEAQAEWEAMKARSGPKVAEIRSKIAVLDPTATDKSPEPTKPGSGGTAPATAAGKPDVKPAAARKEVKGSS